MADLHQKLTTLQGLLPSQRKWLERLVFQLDFNPYQLIFLVGGPGSGKTTVSLAVADLLSDDFNLALLTAEPDLSAGKIRQHLLEQWFGYGAVSDKSLLELAGDRPSPQPLALIIDQSAFLPEELWAELDELPCLVVATALQADPHAELNLPLSPPTMEDAAQLLQEQNFSTLTVAERLEQANGNLHVLLNPQLASKQKSTSERQLTPASIAGPLWTFTIGMAVILAVIVFWFWTERQQSSANGLGTLTYLPEEQAVPPVANQMPSTTPVQRQVVDQLVNELESVKLNQGNTKGMERPVDFSEQTAVSTATPVTTGQSQVESAPEAQSPAQPAPSVNTSQALETAIPQANSTENASVGAADTENDTEKDMQSAIDSAIEDTVKPAVESPMPENSNKPDNASVTNQVAATAQDAAEARLAAELSLSEPETPPTQDSADSSQRVKTQTDKAPQSDDLAAEAAAEAALSNQSAPKTSQAPAVVQAGFDGVALQNLPAEQYALQLVVFSNRAALNNFRQSYPQLKSYTYERQKDGKQQFVVVMAPFDTASAAKAQTRQLPAPLQQGFAKSLADIHSEIRAN